MTLQERLAMNQGQDNGLQAILGAAQDGRNRVQQLPITSLRPKENHTFQVRRDTEYYRALCESICANGIRVPLLVRQHPKAQGAYEIIAGHTRWTAAQEVGLKELPCIVVVLSDAEADIAMGETNIQRPDWLPSERARTFAVWLKATQQRTGITERQRTDLTAGTGFPQSGRNRDAAAEKWGISGKTFDMYLKLNDLYAPLLQIADQTAGSGDYPYARLPVKAAYQLAFMPEEAQRVVYNVMAACTGRTLQEPAAASLRARCEQCGCIEPDDVRGALGLLQAAAKEKKVSFSLPADLLPEGAKELRKDPEFQIALIAWVQEYLQKN